MIFILFSKYANEKVEDNLHKKLFPEVDEYSVIQRHRIVLVLRGEKYEKMIHEGSLK